MELRQDGVCPLNANHPLEIYVANTERVWCRNCGISYLKGELSYPVLNFSRPEPAPKDSISPAIWDLVILDMAKRDQEGLKKYGKRLQANNGRDALVDAYQEALDLVVYMRQAIYERDGA